MNEQYEKETWRQIFLAAISGLATPCEAWAGGVSITRMAVEVANKACQHEDVRKNFQLDVTTKERPFR